MCRNRISADCLLLAMTKHVASVASGLVESPFPESRADWRETEEMGITKTIHIYIIIYTHSTRVYIRKKIKCAIGIQTSNK